MFCIFFRKIWFRNIWSNRPPVDSNCKVISHKTTLTFWIIEICTFIGKNCSIRKNIESMGKAFWNIELILFFSIKNHTIVFSESLAAFSQINGNIINTAFKSTHKLSLRMLSLEVKSSGVIFSIPRLSVRCLIFLVETPFV